MHAYNELYLDDAMDNLGEAFDYASKSCGTSLTDFTNYFVTCGLADEFGHGSPKIVIGMSGTELAREVFRRTFGYDNSKEFPPAQIEYDYSAEYWSGWISAYYQWSRGYSFRLILNHIPIETICHAYHPLHEASEERACAWFDEKMSEIKEVNELQRRRRLLGYTQRLLADRSGVNIRTLQQYEIGSKDLAKAGAATVLSLSDELGCEVRDLLSSV